MKRKTKNIIIVLLILLLGVGSYFTISYASKSITLNSQGMTQGAPSGNTPPSMPSDSNNSNSNSSEQGGGTPPSMPSDSNNSNSNSSEQGGGTPPSMPSDSNNSEQNGSSLIDVSNKLSAFYYVLFGIESVFLSGLFVYLIMSNFNKKTFKETFQIKDKIIIYVLSTALLTGGLTLTDVALAKNFFSSTNSNRTSGKISSSESMEASGVTIVDGDDETLSDTYTSSNSDESAVLVQNGGSATIKNATINKSSGDSSNTENSEFYGINAGLLVKSDSTAKISNTTISTNAKGSNAVFATGDNAKIEISNSTITTTGESSSRGLDATYGGYIKADNVTIKTSGGSCATLATDRGEGTVIANNSNLETNGSGSPVIYSTGDISIDKTIGVANGSQMVVIEGKNSATVTNSTLTASGKGNRNNVDNAGVMIYQSMSGDASEGTGTFTAKNSNLRIDSNSSYYKSAPMFFITNTDAVINLESTKLVFGSNVLISAKGTDEWGNSNSNGGNLTLNAKNQELIGNIEIDKISTLSLNLSSSNYEGTINGDNSAKEITLKLDKNSKIILTGDSYVTSLDDADTSYSNIDFNGYKLYVNGKSIN